ncbi:MAG: fibronectin type III domain-containing protein, partial [Candidatus Tectomicrobia bacterium]|nr:fibronectin type III domain-containing protein [Candidatus Tectomicrobia bacterium]
AATDNVGVMGYRIYQGDTLLGTVDGSTTSYEVIGLSPKTQYGFTVKAGDAAGNWSSAGLSVSVKTKAAADNAPPSWPRRSSLTASNVGTTSLTLSWPAATDNVGVTGYQIYQGDTLLATVDGSATSYEVTGLSPETPYSFKVKAGDGAGNWSKNALSASVTTLGETDTTPPSWPTRPRSQLRVSGVGATSLTLNWPAAKDDVGVTGYRIRIYKKEKQEKTLVATVEVLDTSYEVTGLSSKTTYLFEVEAGDAADNWSGKLSVTRKTR